MTHRARRVVSVGLAAIPALGLGLLLASEVVGIDMEHAASPRLYLPSDAPTREIVIVLGAPVGTMLGWRMDAACALIERGAAERMLLTGAQDELPFMRERAAACLPPERVLVDDQAARTLDNLRNARLRFGVVAALVVTQRFHLPRALALADAVGIDALGVIAEGEPDLRGRLRERFARLRALVDRAQR